MHPKINFGLDGSSLSSDGDDNSTNSTNSTSDPPVKKRPAFVLERLEPELTVEEYRQRLEDQGKFEDRKPGTGSKDGCLHDPPKLPPKANILLVMEPEPTRDDDGTLIFPDHPEFTPNLTPREVFQLGSFGGTYFRNIESAVTGRKYRGRQVLKEFPTEWFLNIDICAKIISPTYDKKVNKYGVSCGGSLGQWESSGWITEMDPYGWFQWYCRFYLGRRTTDDERQIKRWLAGQGPKGRWRSRVCNDLIKAGKPWNHEAVSKVCRQVMQHWAYRLTEADFNKHFSKD